MTSWITYARPFAKRRAEYRKRAEENRQQGAWGWADICDDCQTSIDSLWRDFKAAMEGKT